MNSKLSLRVAGLLGALTVIIGAFGAHALRATLESADRLDTFETAVKYQMYHTLALFLVGILQLNFSHQLLRTAAILFVIGIIVFSGSLYVLCLTGITILGAITPFGGVFLIVGWFCIVLAVSKIKSGNS